MFVLYYRPPLETMSSKDQKIVGYLHEVLLQQILWKNNKACFLWVCIFPYITATITTLQLLPTNLPFSSLSHSLIGIPFPSQPLNNTQLLSMLPNYRVEARQFCACFQVMHILNGLLIGRQVEEATHSSTFHKVVIFKKLTGPSHFKMHVPLLMITSGKNG